MDTRTQLAFWLDQAWKILTLVLVPILGMWFEQHRKTDAQSEKQKLEQRLAAAAASAVASVYETFVKNLKDPTKPGTWDEIAAQTAKDMAVTFVKDTVPDVIDRLNDHGVDAKKLLGQQIEQQNLELKRRISGTLAAPGATPSPGPVPPKVVAVVANPPADS